MKLVSNLQGSDTTPIDERALVDPNDAFEIDGVSMQERPSAIEQNNDRMDYSHLLNDDIVNSKPLSAVGLGEHRMPPIIDLLSYISAADLSQQTGRKLSSSIQD